MVGGAERRHAGSFEVGGDGVEIVAGVFVGLKPRYGAYVVAAWLGGIIVDLLTYSGCYDVALRDFGLVLGALTLARLASKYDRPGLGATA